MRVHKEDHTPAEVASLMHEGTLLVIVIRRPDRASIKKMSPSKKTAVIADLQSISSLFEPMNPTWIPDGTKNSGASNAHFMQCRVSQNHLIDVLSNKNVIMIKIEDALGIARHVKLTLDACCSCISDYSFLYSSWIQMGENIPHCRWKMRSSPSPGPRQRASWRQCPSWLSPQSLTQLWWLWALYGCQPRTRNSNLQCQKYP